MFGLHIFDLLALAAYLGGITVIGIWASRRVKSTSEFIMPRRFGKVMMMMHGLGTATHSDQAVSVASKSYTTGLSGIWYSWKWLFVTPFFWLIAPMMRRFRAQTTGDVFEARFDRSVSGLYAAIGLGKFMVNIGLMLKGSSVIIDAVTDGKLPTHTTIACITILFVIYGLAGGLTAAIVTDFIQGILTIVFSFLLLPLVLNAVGGLSGMKAKLVEISPDADMMSLVAPGDIGVWFIFMITVNALLGVAVQPQNMGTCAAGKTEIEGAVGFMGGTMLKRICTVAWAVTGLGAVAYYGNTITEPDLIYGQVARDFLPTLMPGLLGLFIAALLATVMGSCDSFMVASSGLVTNNIYKPLNPGKPDKHYLNISRFAGLIAVSGGVLLAFLATGVIPLLENLWKINTMVAMAFWLGIFWRRTTVAGAWAATLGAMLTWWMTTRPEFVQGVTQLQFLVDWGVVKSGKIFLPWQMLMYIIAGFGAGIVVSLFTQPVSDEKLDRFYGLLRTPVQPDEELTESCTLPQGMEPGPRKVFFPNSNWEIPIPGKTALLGLAAGWACVLSIIGVVYFWIAG
ncbi:MAG: sodium:solute symporter family protein [Limisphaerales bacterium]